VSLRLSDKEFISLWQLHGSAAAVAKALNRNLRGINKRRRAVELKHKISLPNAEDVRGRNFSHLQTAHKHGARVELGILNGVVLVFSDAHFWPALRSTAFRGLLWAIRELQPKAVICNGDAFDGASISRYPRIGWDSKPSVVEELKACEYSLGEIEETAKNAKLVWTLGNHDARYENMLAQHAGQYEGVKGFSLKDHFPAWTLAWSCWPNEHVVVKHRYKGGIHATHNNTVHAGKSIVTGHLHSLKVTPYSDYNKHPRFGVDTGTLAEIDGPQFVDYLEDNPVNWRSGFAVLTFNDGRLLWPELVHRYADGIVEFRGQLIDVSKL
jgi:hypothetical protein